MNQTYLLTSPTAVHLYNTVCDLPIYDYHCHLSPKEIYENKPFSDVGEMMLACDHYKWRLMRAVGIHEELITGNASYRDKFLAYASAIEMAAGNPLYHWTEMELALYFNITEPLTSESAPRIYDAANAILAERAYSPRKLIEMSRVRWLATTDDPTDPLTYHRLMEEDTTFRTAVTPSFRTDHLLSIRRPSYTDYLSKLATVTGRRIVTLADLDAAICERLDVFVSHGCRFSDIGIPDFPWLAPGMNPEAAAAEALTAVTEGRPVDDDTYFAFLYRMYIFLGREYKRRGIIMQWHLAVQRNVNSELLRQCGPDAGGDCIGDAIPVRRITALLDALQEADGLPETIIYTLNPAMNDALAAAAYSFRGVHIGAAWWFCDHLDGIRDVLRSVARTGHLTGFVGMLTDSRSFLSYSRHDYFRRILCSVIAEWVDRGEFRGNAVTLASRLASETCRDLIGYQEKGGSK